MSFDKIRVLILDDEIASSEHSKAAMTAFIPEENIYLASSAVEAMRILEYSPVDLAFLDIEMPDTDGFSIAEYVHKSHPQIKVVFLTGHAELGAKSFDYEPFDFLTKPVDVMRLRKTLDRYVAREQNAQPKKELVAVDTGTGLVLLCPTDIRYIAKEKRKTVIYCAEESYNVQYSLEELEIIFSDYGMFRSHQSFLVPLDKIVSVQPADFGKTYVANLQGGGQVPVSRIQYSKLRGHLIANGIRIL